MSKYVIQTRKTGALGATMSAGANSCTLAAATFGTPTGKQIITIDGDDSALAADFLCTIAGTAVTSMTLLNGSDVEHAEGATVWMGMVDEHFDNLADPLDSGWVDASKDEEWVYASASSFTIASVDLTSKYLKGTKLKWTDSGGVKYGVVASSSFSTNTTVNIIVNTDYVVANSAITLNYYSYAETPQGFPPYFSYTPTFTNLTVGSGTISAKYSLLEGRTIKFHISLTFAGDTAVGTNPNVSLPATSVTYSNFHPIAIGSMNDGGGAVRPLAGTWLTTTTMAIFSVQSVTLYQYISTTHPATWTTTDILMLDGAYQMA